MTSPKPTASVRRLAPFSTPLFRVGLAPVLAVNDALERIVMAHKAQEPNVDRSQRGGGWSSGEIHNVWTEPEISLLNSTVESAVRQVLEHQFPGAAPIDVEIGMAWANIYPTGAYRVVHDHAGYSWSGCYYVAGQNQDARIGELVVVNPVPQGQLSWQPQQVSLLPEPGELILFPATWLHYVPPNASEANRICFAFNFVTRPRQTPWIATAL